MRYFITGCVLALFGVCAPLDAQVKFANLDASGNNGLKSKGIAFEQARDRADLRHGTLVSLELADGTKVTGHVVRFDQTNKRIHVRTQPGELPVAYSEDNLKQVARATREADDHILRAGLASSGWRDLPGSKGLEENDNGVIRIKRPGESTGIKLAALSRRDESDKPLMEESTTRVQSVVEPEITRQVIYNGGQRSVQYFSTSVSPGEREILDQLQKAENDLLALTTQKDQRDQAIALEMSMHEERLKNQKLVNLTLENENKVNYPYPPTSETESVLPGPHLLETRVVTQRQAPKGVVIQAPQVLPGPTAILERLPAVDPQAVVKAREHYQQLLRAHAFFEEGRLVAVVAAK